MSDEFAGLGLTELYDLLEPVPEPPPVSMMPQTVGWIWLGLALLAAVALTLRAVLRHRRANAYRRAGLVALAAAGDDPARIAAAIRRTALAGFSRETVAGLTGDRWLRFLDDTLPGGGFADGPGRVLAEAPYRAAAAAPGLAELARRWIARHRRPAP